MKILQTIFQPPQTELTINRAGLLKQIWGNREKKIIFIKAGPGYGKTVLAASYFNMVDNKVWLAIPKGFISFFEFLCHLVYGLDQLLMSQQSKHLVSTCQGMRTEELVIEIINLISAEIHEEMHIFIDDFDYLLFTEKRTSQFIELFFNFLPINVHLIITSHVDLPIPIATISKNANFFQLSQLNLQFSLEELRELLAFHHVILPVSALYTLYNLSDGWIIVINLFLSHFKILGDGWHEILQQTKEHISDYIDYFLHSLPAEDLEFLQSVCLFDKIEVDYCNHFLKRNDTRDFLNHLTSSNLLTKFDEDVFELHQLIKEKLLKDMDQTLINQGYAVLAELYLNLNRQKDAIFYLIKSKQIERAEKMILEMTRDSIKDTISMQHWLDHLPVEYIIDRPYLIYYRGQIKEKIGQFDEALLDYQKASQIFEANHQYKEVTMAGVQLIGIHWHKRDFEKTIHMAQELLPAVLADDYGALATLHNILGTSFLEQLRREEGVQHLLKAREYCQLSGDSNFEGWILNNLAYWGYIPTGLVECAIETYQQALRIFEQNNDLSGQCLILLNLSNLYLRMNRTDSVLEMLKRADEINTEMKNLPGIQSTLILKARYYLLINEFDQALLNLESLENLHKLNDFMKTQAYLTYSYYCTAVGQNDRAMVWVNQALEVTSFATNYLISEFKIQKLKLLFMQKEFAEALELVDEIIQMTEGLGYRLYLAEALFFKTAILKVTRCDFGQVLGVFLDIFAQCKLDFLLKKYAILTQCLETELGMAFHGRENIKELLQEVESLSKKANKLDLITKGSSLLRIWMFGQFKLYTSQGYFLGEDWRNKKAANIFKYLLLNRNQWILQDQIIELFWPDSDPEKAKQSLYVSLYTIRKNLEPELLTPRDSRYILSQHGYLKFNTNQPFWLDVNEFDKYYQESLRLLQLGLQQKAEEFLLKAKELYEQELLPDNIYDDWAIEYREFYQNLYLDLLQRLITSHQKKHSTQVRSYIEDILRIDQFHQNANSSLIELYINNQELDKARAHYQQLCTIFEEELGIEPPRVIVERFANILKFKK